MTNNIENLIFQSNKKLSDSIEIVRYRRINWTLISKTINSEFSTFVEQCSAKKFPYEFRIDYSNEHTNEATIQISCINHPRTNLRKINASSTENPNVFEKGGSLVVSQGYNGLILFIFTPLRTEKVKLKYSEILISRLVDPRKVDAEFLHAILKKYLLLIRYTSLHGDQTLSLLERLSIILIFITDIRFKHKFVKSVISMKNKWSHSVIAALLAAAFTYYFSVSCNC